MSVLMCCRFTCMPPGTVLSPADGNWFPTVPRPIKAITGHVQVVLTQL